MRGFPIDTKLRQRTIRAPMTKPRIALRRNVPVAGVYPVPNRLNRPKRLKDRIHPRDVSESRADCLIEGEDFERILLLCLSRAAIGIIVIKQLPRRWAVLRAVCLGAEVSILVMPTDPAIDDNPI